MFGSIRSPWPIASGSYTLGSMDSPIALAVIGRAIFELGKEHYCIRGHLRSANIGIEKLIANVVSNPRIRFLIICGREEGHMPGNALFCLAQNGVNDDMSIKGTQAQLPYLTDITPEAAARFREQVKVIDLVNPKVSDGAIDWQDPTFNFDADRLEELERAIAECERADPGPYPAAPMLVHLPEPLRTSSELGKMLESQVDRISSLMLRMPSEKLNTSSDYIIVSDEFQVLIDPIDGTLIQVPSLDFFARMRTYLTGQEP